MIKLGQRKIIINSNSKEQLNEVWQVLNLWGRGEKSIIIIIFVNIGNSRKSKKEEKKEGNRKKERKIRIKSEN